MIRRPPRSTQSRSSAASDVYKRQRIHRATRECSAGARRHLIGRTCSSGDRPEPITTVTAPRPDEDEDGGAMASHLRTSIVAIVVLVLAVPVLFWLKSLGLVLGDPWAVSYTHLRA